jgi:hypothetical protein
VFLLLVAVLRAMLMVLSDTAQAMLGLKTGKHLQSPFRMCVIEGDGQCAA